MSYDPSHHHRRSIRLKGYDYSLPGAYYVTIVTQTRTALFGEILGTEMRLNQAGQMIDNWWATLAERFPTITLDTHVIMPNHINGIVVITAGPTPESPNYALDAPALAAIVQWFKTMTTNAYIRAIKADGWPQIQGRLWQRNYYEHVIRNDVELERIRAYIQDNPAKWQEDTENPAHPL